MIWFRHWAAVHLPLITMLVCYSFLVTLGNVLFAAFGEPFIGFKTDIFSFSETFTPGFWALLFLPYVMMPPVYILGRRLLAGPAESLARITPVIGPLALSLILFALLALAAKELIGAQVIALSSGAVDTVTSIEARFEILNRLGFQTLVVLQSLLPFATFVALISAMRSGRSVWWALASFAVVGTTLCLVALNMKWPVVVFYMGITIAVFSYAPRWAYTATAACMIMLFLVYFSITSLVFRIAPLGETVPIEVQTQADIKTDQKSSRNEGSAVLLETRLQTAASLGGVYLKHAVIRLALGFPYYYHVFTSEGPVCGGVLEQAQRGPACRPSKLIYSQMYPDDQFQNRGTVGISVHVSAYALGGWHMAILSLVAASLVLAGFSCLPLEGNPTVAALRTIGAIAGYHFSQIPGEGVFLYDHGLLWVFLLLVILKIAFSVRRIAG